MTLRNRFTEMPKGLLAPRRIGGPVPWIIGIMAFLMALAGAAALGLTRAAQGASSGVEQRAVVQVIDADAARRDANAAKALATLRASPAVESATPVADAQLAGELKPWLGDATGLPLPAVIDVVLKPGMAVPRLEPSVRVERQSALLGPLGDFLRTLGLLALAIVLMMALVAVAATVLAARAAFEAQRDTVEVLHLIGATDQQVKGAFQRRVALDALSGGAIGALAGLAVAALIAGRLSALDAGLAGGGLRGLDWLLIVLLPLIGAMMAVVAARRTVAQALEATP
ncbi:MAG TPA: FtsX-like permease family protein [Sphingomonas sp.]|nr:FtsX-like permease family protein [Sphingomonas sp.]